VQTEVLEGSAPNDSDQHMDDNFNVSKYQFTLRDGKNKGCGGIKGQGAGVQSWC
jgi:hypothetical protein